MSSIFIYELIEWIFGSSMSDGFCSLNSTWVLSFFKCFKPSIDLSWAQNWCKRALLPTNQQLQISLLLGFTFSYVGLVHKVGLIWPFLPAKPF